MKRFANGLAVFAVVAGLAFVTSCSSSGGFLGSLFGGGSEDVSVRNAVLPDEFKTLTGLSGATYTKMVLYSNNTLEATNSAGKVKGTWSSTDKGSMNSRKADGATMTVTIDSKTGKGVVKVLKSEEYGYKMTYSVELGAFGSYSFMFEDDGR